MTPRRARARRRYASRLARHVWRAWCRRQLALWQTKESPRPVYDHPARAWD
jgi:hypothetical protein